MFLVIGIPALVLFDLGATRSFVYVSLSKKFNVDPWALYFPLEVMIVNDRIMSASRVHQDCVMVMFRVQFPIDLNPISLRWARIIVGKAEAPMLKSIDFQFTTKEARETLDVVIGMYSYLIIFISLVMLMFVRDVIQVVPSQWNACSFLF